MDVLPKTGRGSVYMELLYLLGFANDPRRFKGLWRFGGGNGDSGEVGVHTTRTLVHPLFSGRHPRIKDQTKDSSEL